MIIAQDYFITGTDTGAGKTYIACKLIRHFVAQGYRVVGMKPVAAGCDWVDGVWVNEDVQLLNAASNVKAPLSLINPYCFKAPIAPHIAAEQEQQIIDLEPILSAYRTLREMADIVIVEGAGGLLVPLNPIQTMADLIQELSLPSIVVVGLKLGCINHSLLTVEVMRHQGLHVAHWVANPIDPEMLVRQENIATLTAMFHDISRLELGV